MTIFDLNLITFCASLHRLIIPSHEQQSANISKFYMHPIVVRTHMSATARQLPYGDYFVFAVHIRIARLPVEERRWHIAAMNALRQPASFNCVSVRALKFSFQLKVVLQVVRPENATHNNIILLTTSPVENCAQKTPSELECILSKG